MCNLTGKGRHWITGFLVLCFLSCLNLNVAASQRAMQVLALDCDHAFIFNDDTEFKGNNVDITSSNGSRLPGQISTEALVLLDEISLLVPIVCVTGLPASRLESWYKKIPMISNWVVENGGRLFSRQRDNRGISSLVENEEYASHVKQNIKQVDRDLLTRYALEMIDEGFTVEKEGYNTMFRITESVDNVSQCDVQYEINSLENSNCRGDLSRRIAEAKLPNGLSISNDNVHYADIQIGAVSKLSGIEWITSKIAYATNSDTNQGFLWVGPGYSDVVVAKNAFRAFVTQPCSPPMKLLANAPENNVICSSTQGRLDIATALSLALQTISSM